MQILLLWASLADYSVAALHSLSKKNCSLSIIYQPIDANAPYKDFDMSFAEYHINYNSLSEKKIEDFCYQLKPNVIIMASWNYPLYMKIAKKLKKEGTYVVSTFDGQWEATLKQRLGIIVSPFLLKPSIDNFFVPGDRQAVFARKLGYPNPFLGYYSANSSLFFNKKNTFPSKFIFCGRLVSIKGIDYLVKAYLNYRKIVSKPWDLMICGKGQLETLFNNIDGVECKGFQDPKSLASCFTEASCLILPSYHEPWGVVIHEAALAGLSIISSHACGAATYFVRDGQNGFLINADEDSLTNAMVKMSTQSPQKLMNMSSTSNQLGQFWTTDKWADYVEENILSKVNSNTQNS